MERTNGIGGAPVFGVDGRLTAVSLVPRSWDQSQMHPHALTGAPTTKSARAIEEQFFRGQFRREWIIAVLIARFFPAPESGSTTPWLA